jgi:glycosyltransferase involved in cell wall biosynthesis
MDVEVHVWEERRRVERAAYRKHRSKVGKLRVRVPAIVHRACFLRRQRINLLHMSNATCQGCDDWLPAAWLAGIPAITNQSGLFEYQDNPIKRWLAKRWRRVIAVSEHVECQLLAAGFSPERVRKIAPGIDIDTFTRSVLRSCEDVRREFGVSPAELMVTMVGQIRSLKGQAVVLEALQNVDEELRARLKVFFVGGVSEDNKPYFDSLRRAVVQAGLCDHVRFLGERADVPDLMNAADIVLHASTVPEPFGLVIVEAMALGKPVIAASAGGPTEILTPRLGLMFDTDRPEELAQHLTQLADDPGFRELLGARARERAREFSVTPMVRATEDLYAELLGERRREMPSRRCAAATTHAAAS